MSYRAIRVTKGNGGWGEDLILTPTDAKHIILSVTNGGIHPVAARMAELSGATAVDGFTNHVADEEVLAAVINCGGTARIGVYPKKRIPTVDIYPGAPSGPLAKYITPDIFVSAVGVGQVGPSAATASDPASDRQLSAAEPAQDAAGQASPQAMPAQQPNVGGFMGMVVRFGNAIGYVINTLLASGRQALDIIMKTVLPFMAYVALLIGIVTFTGISDWLANAVSPLAGNPFGLVLLGVIVGLPFLSPVLGPGAAIAQVIGVLMGEQIGKGALPVQYALPALFAIDGQVGCDFIPVGLSLGEAKPETVSIGVSAVLFTRMVTSPVAVLLAYLASFLLV